MSTFAGFDQPQANYSKLPHALIDELSNITSESELKVILYILRHTWGYHDTEKKITIDEFCNGRKRSDGSRIDGGCGITTNAVKSGIARAIEHGYILVEEDARDLARIKRYYSINSEGQKLTAGGQSLTPGVSQSDPRTEKDTLERNLKDTSFSDEKDTPPPSEKPKTPRKPKTPKAEKTEPPIKEPTEHQEMFGALCTLVGWDYKTITKDQKGQVAQALGVLEKAGYTMDSLRAFFMHWRNKDWRGRKGETPTLSQVRSEIGKIKTTTTNGINWEKHHAINVANYTPTQYDLAEITF